MLAAAIFVCRALQCISHITSKPKRDFHETVVGFSKQSPIGLTVKISHVPEIADSFHDLPEDFVNIELIHRLGSGERTIACNALLRVLNISSEHFPHDVAGIRERFLIGIIATNGRCQCLIVIKRIARGL
jgi:hypothetical protein